MKKIIPLCIVIGAFTVSNNMFGMLRYLKSQALHQNGHQIPKRMISIKSGEWPDVPYHRNYVYNDGTGTTKLRDVLEENKILMQHIHKQNDVVNRLIEINKTKLTSRNSIELQLLEDETYHFARQFNDLEEIFDHKKEAL